MNSYEGLYRNICKELNVEFGKAYEGIKTLKDKLHRRNMQIKDLERQIRSLKAQVNRAKAGETLY